MSRCTTVTVLVPGCGLDVTDVSPETARKRTKVDERARRAPARPVETMTLALVILLLIAVDMTLAEARLSPEEHQMFSDLIANIGIVLAVTSLWSAGRKR